MLLDWKSISPLAYASGKLLPLALYRQSLAAAILCAFSGAHLTKSSNVFSPFFCWKYDM
jgi:hypothetical protein